MDLIQSIFFELGKIEHHNYKARNNIKLRKSNRIKTIKSSVAIEGNTLSLEQVTDILNGHKVIAPQKDLIEVKNAISTYENFDTFDALQIQDLLKAHKLLMIHLTDNPGEFRNNQIGVFKGGEPVHIAPPPLKVPELMTNLFEYLQKSDDSFLIKSCVFHYELEFIHPFCDGNGRMGRLWQQVLLTRVHPIFKLVCIEELLEKFQNKYYEALHNSDINGNSSSFIEFMLSIILNALQQLNTTIKPNTNNTFIDRLLYAQNFLNDFKRKDYMKLFPEISTATASRDLINGVKNGILEKENTNNKTTYRFVNNQ